MSGAAQTSSLEHAVNALMAVDTFSLDLETTGFNPHRDAIKGASLSVGPGDDETWWFPFKGEDAVSSVRTFRALAPVFSDPAKTLVGSNVKFDVKFVAVHHPEILIRNPFADTVVAHWLIDENSQHGLKQLAKRYLDVDMASYKEASQFEGGLFGHIFADYAKEDAKQVLRLWREALEPALRAQDLDRLFHEVEMPLVRTLIEMEMHGVAIDLDFLADLDRRMQAQRDEAKAEAFAAAEREFEIGSPQEVSKLLFGDYGLEPFDWMEKGKSGYYSTDDSILERYKGDKLVAAVLKHRNAAHMMKTYCVPYARRTKEEPRIRAEFNQAGTVRGRFSCLPGWARIATSAGIIPIREARPGMLVQTPEGPAPITQHVRTGRKRTIRLTLESGRSLVCTPEHRVFCDGQWVPAGEVRPGDSLYACGSEAPEAKALAPLPPHPRLGRKAVRFPKSLGEATAFLFGHFLAEGCVGFNRQRPSKWRKSPPAGTPIPAKVVLAFGWDEDDLLEFVQDEWERIFGVRGKRVDGTCPQLVINSIDIGTWLGEAGCGGKSQEKRVPEAVFRSPPAVVRAFLRGLFEGDGGSTEGYPHLSTESEGLARDVATLLAALGVHFSVVSARRKRREGVRHRVVVLSQSWEKFADLGLFWSERKLSAVRVGSRSGRLTGVAQPPWMDLSGLRARVKDAHGWGGPCKEATQAYRLDRNRGRLTPTAMDFLSPGLDLSEEADQFIDWARRTDALSLRVIDVGEAGEEETYDIAVADTECFLVDGVVVHNSNNPNLQQVTASIKKLFVASEGKKMVGGDFNQLQFRLVGHFAERILGRSKVAEAYRAGLDLHTKTQQEMGFKDRRPAKVVNFAFIFGRGPKSFAHDNEKDMDEAREYYDGFHAAYPEIREMAQWCREEITSKGYVTSIAGRRLHFPDMKGLRITGARKDPTYWPGWVSWNAVIQGAEADLVRVAMRNIQRRIDAKRVEDPRWFEVYLQLQVHDELVGEAPEDLAEEFAAIMKEEAESAVALEVPIVFEVLVGDSWSDVKG